METKQHKFNWGNLIVGILFILGSLLAFANPSNSLVGLTVFIGSIAIVEGVFDIFLRNKIKQLTGYRSTMMIVGGVIDIILGILLITNIGVGLLALPMIFAIWFIVDSIENLFLAGSARLISNGFYWFTIIMNILGVIVGFMLLANPASSALTLSFLIGFYLMMFGILNIVEAFAK